MNKSLMHILATAAFAYGAAMTLYPVKLAAEGLRVDDRMESRQERREDRRENVGDGVEDRHEVREQRRELGELRTLGRFLGIDAVDLHGTDEGRELLLVAGRANGTFDDVALAQTGLSDRVRRYVDVLVAREVPGDAEEAVALGKDVEDPLADLQLGLVDRFPAAIPIPVAIPAPAVAATLLVVDDDDRSSRLLEGYLLPEGYRVQTARDGPAGLALARQEVPDVILLDVKMPEMDGVEVLQKAKEILPEINVIMMTAYATVETAVEAMKIGALDYLVKPFDPETLVPMVLQTYQNLAVVEGRQIEVSALVLCGGTRFFDPATGKNTFGYKTFPNVVTSLEFERILSASGPTMGHLQRPSDGKEPKKIAWLQCVGSRDSNQCGNSYCSSVCCMYAIKQAMLLSGSLPLADITIYYMDIRAFGKGYEQFYQTARAMGIEFVKAKVARIDEQPDGYSVHGPQRLFSAAVDSHDDHRLAMSLAVAGLVTHGLTLVKDARCAHDSFPGFVETMRELGADMEWVEA